MPFLETKKLKHRDLSKVEVMARGSKPSQCSYGSSVCNHYALLPHIKSEEQGEERLPRWEAREKAEQRQDSWRELWADPRAEGRAEGARWDRCPLRAEHSQDVLETELLMVLAAEIRSSCWNEFSRHDMRPMSKHPGALLPSHHSGKNHTWLCRPEKWPQEIISPELPWAGLQDSNGN